MTRIQQQWRSRNSGMACWWCKKLWSAGTATSLQLQRRSFPGGINLEQRRSACSWESCIRSSYILSSREMSSLSSTLTARFKGPQTSQAIVDRGWHAMTENSPLLFAHCIPLKREFKGCRRKYEGTPPMENDFWLRDLRSRPLNGPIYFKNKGPPLPGEGLDSPLDWVCVLALLG